MTIAAQLLARLGSLAVLLLATTTSCAASARATEQPYTFVQDGRRYTFMFEFDVAARPDDVLDALYLFPNLKQYSRGTSEVELLDAGPDWQSVRFTYSTWLWTMSTTFRREIDRTRHVIRFRMIEAERTGLPVPLPTASSGEYRLETLEGGVRVIYVQTAETSDSLLLRPWMARAQAEAVLFAHDLEAYVRSSLQ